MDFRKSKCVSGYEYDFQETLSGFQVTNVDFRKHEVDFRFSMWISGNAKWISDFQCGFQEMLGGFQVSNVDFHFFQ